MSSIHLSSISFELDKKKLIELINCNQDDVIFISGSLVEGIGNEKSDLDIFVLVDDFENLNSNFDYNFNEVKLKFEKLNSLGCDIEFWPLKVVIELIEQINKIDFENPNLRSLNQIKITNYEFRKLSSFIHRFLVSECVFNDEKYNKLKDKINVPKFCRLMTRYNVNMVDNLYEDIIGNLEKKEDETAVIISKDFLMKTITAYLFSNLYTLDREKWIYIKLKILAENYIEAKGVLDDFQNLYFQRTFSAPNEARDLVEDIIYFSNDIVSKIENKLGEYNMKQIYKKDLNFRTRTISHKKILIGNSKAFELNDTGYIIWENIDGRTDVQELIKLLVDEYNCSVDEIESDIINFLSFLNSISAIKAVV